MFWTALWIVSMGAVTSEAVWTKSPGRQQEEGGGGMGSADGKLLGVVLRLLGADSRKTGEFAFEGFISLVHLMCRVLIPDAGTERTDRVSGQFSLFRFIVNHPQAGDLLVSMRNPAIVDEILQESRQKLQGHPPDDVDCILLLTCKTKPFVRGMQKSLTFFIDRDNSGCRERGGDACEEETAWEEAGTIDRMYFFMPGLQEVVENGRRCDRLFPNCLY